ncbi:TPA: hypothetical protein ACWW7I_005039 [Klebsiella pneumoniae]
MKKTILALCVAAIPLVSTGAEYVTEGSWQVKKEENKMTDIDLPPELDTTVS